MHGSPSMDMSLHLMRSPQMPLDQGTEGKTNTHALLDLMEKYGYNMVQKNGQRRFGPPPDWIGPPPPQGCEVFIGRIPHDVFEDELVPVFESVGPIYEFRLMLKFSGENRGYAFVTYTNQKDSQSAVDALNKYELRPGHQLCVCIISENSRLFLGGLPRGIGQKELQEELKKVTIGVEYAVVYPTTENAAARRKSAFAFVQYESHQSAALARRKLRSDDPYPFTMASKKSSEGNKNKRKAVRATIEMEVSFARFTVSQHTGDAGGVMKNRDTHREPGEPQTNSRMVDHMMSHRITNPSEARPHGVAGIPGPTRHLAVDLGEAFSRIPNAQERCLSPQEIDLAVPRTATVRLELWCTLRGLAPPSYTPFHSHGSNGQQLYGYMVHIFDVHERLFSPEEVGSVLDGAKELAAQSVLRSIGNIEFNTGAHSNVCHL
uniref:probable RNA-binding protein 46 n=1 Tax=Myxine glutinosa TaxID=7769 RepID=UPI00358E2D20